MSAKIDNIVAKERHDLSKEVPLSTPYVVCVDPSNVCNIKCNFCAIQSSTVPLHFKKQLMDETVFRKVIDDAKLFPEKIKALRITGQGEPLLNPHLPELIRYAVDANVAEWVEIISNGTLLKPELNERLASSGADRIRISVEALSSEDYERVTGRKIDFDAFLENIRDLHTRCQGKCEIYVKAVDALVRNDEERDRFFSLFSDICDKMFVDHVIPMWSDYQEIKEIYSVQGGVHGQEITTSKLCALAFYSLLVNSDGEVTVCCSDWKRKFVVGNVNDKSIYEIWNSPKLRAFWINMAKGQKDLYEMCRLCALPQYDTNDYLDDKMDALQQRLTDAFGKN